MAKIVCASLDCKYISDRNTCTLKSIKLSDCYYNTINEGYKHFHSCKNYVQEETIEQIQKEIKRWFDGYTNGNSKR